MKDTIDIKVDGVIMTCDIEYNCFIGNDTKDGEDICEIGYIACNGIEVSNLITDDEIEHVQNSLITTYTNYQNNKWEDLREEMNLLENYIKE